MFWTVLQICVAIILTLNSSIPLFILAAFLNGFSMGGSVGQRIVLIIDLIGQKLLVSNFICDLSVTNPSNENILISAAIFGA